jgi:hypothetical protein
MQPRRPIWSRSSFRGRAASRSPIPMPVDRPRRRHVAPRACKARSIASEGIGGAGRAGNRGRRGRVIVDDEMAGLRGAAAQGQLAHGVAAHRVGRMRGVADQDREPSLPPIVGKLVAMASALGLDARLAQGEGDERGRGIVDLAAATDATENDGDLARRQIGAACGARRYRRRRQQRGRWRPEVMALACAGTLLRVTGLAFALNARGRSGPFPGWRRVRAVRYRIRPRCPRTTHGRRPEEPIARAPIGQCRRRESCG